MKKLFLLSFLYLIFCSSTFGQILIGNFKKGHYYTKDGTKREGLLRFQYDGKTDKSDGDCSLDYKAFDKAGKENFTTDDVCCFVIGMDSFATVKNMVWSPMVTYAEDFAQVVETGKMNLYVHWNKSQQGTYTNWVIGKDKKVEKLTRDQFNDLMPAYLADYPELLKQVQSRDLRFDDIQEIVKKYNAYFKQKAYGTR
jgi:hypothetical protein